MRILYSHRIHARDGQGVHVEELIAAFRADGHEVLIVQPKAYAEASFDGAPGRLDRLRALLPGGATEVAELGYAMLAYRRLRRAYRDFRPDLVYERYNLFHLAGALLARRHGAKLVLEVNSPLAHERSAFGGLRLRRVARAIERWTWRSAERVLPVTGVLADTIMEAGIARDRIVVVPNGVVLNRFPWPPGPRASGPVRLGFAGFVREWHGLDRVLAQMAADPMPEAGGLFLDVVGDGPARPALESQARALGIADRVRFRGVVPPESVPAIVGTFDIALQPRVVPWASPLKNFDYMAAGRAIVAPDQPNMWEILRDGETALLFDPDSDGALWAAIRRLARDAALRERLGMAAREDLERRGFTWAGNAARIAALAQPTG